MTFLEAHTKLVDTLLQISNRVDEEDGKESQTTRRLVRYQENMGKTPEKFILAQFRRLIEKHRSSLERGPVYDAWLKNERLVIALPLSATAARNLAAGKAELHLGLLYRAALRLQEETQLKLDSGEEDEALSERYANSRELILPQIVKLNLYTMFSMGAEAMGEPAGTNAVYANHVYSLKRDLGGESNEFELRSMLGMLKDQTSFIGKLYNNLAPTLSNWGLDLEKVIPVITDMIENPDLFDVQKGDPYEVLDRVKGLLKDKIANPDGEIKFGKETVSVDNLGDLALKALRNPMVQKILADVRTAAQAEGGVQPMSLLIRLAGYLNDPAALAAVREITGQEIDPSVTEQLSKGFGALTTFADTMGIKTDPASVKDQAPLRVECDNDMCTRGGHDEFEE